MVPGCGISLFMDDGPLECNSWCLPQFWLVCGILCRNDWWCDPMLTAPESDDNDVMYIGDRETTGFAGPSIQLEVCILTVQHVQRYTVMPVLISKLLNKWESSFFEVTLSIHNQNCFWSKFSSPANNPDYLITWTNSVAPRSLNYQSTSVIRHDLNQKFPYLCIAEGLGS